VYHQGKLNQAGALGAAQQPVLEVAEQQLALELEPKLAEQQLTMELVQLRQQHVAPLVAPHQTQIQTVGQSPNCHIPAHCPRSKIDGDNLESIWFCRDSHMDSLWRGSLPDMESSRIQLGSESLFTHNSIWNPTGHR
jgi:hypothetical protein